VGGRVRGKALRDLRVEDCEAYKDFLKNPDPRLWASASCGIRHSDGRSPQVRMDRLLCRLSRSDMPATILLMGETIICRARQTSWKAPST
jgi:hypothetical protein